MATAIKMAFNSRFLLFRPGTMVICRPNDFPHQIQVGANQRETPLCVFTPRNGVFASK